MCLSLRHISKMKVLSKTFSWGLWIKCASHVSEAHGTVLGWSKNSFAFIFLLHTRENLWGFASQSEARWITPGLISSQEYSDCFRDLFNAHVIECKTQTPLAKLHSTLKAKRGRRLMKFFLEIFSLWPLPCVRENLHVDCEGLRLHVWLGLGLHKLSI